MLYHTLNNSLLVQKFLRQFKKYEKLLKIWPNLLGFILILGYANLL